MQQENLKQELIKWLNGLDDSATIQYLKVLKDSHIQQMDWWNELSVEHQNGIKRGLHDMKKVRSLLINP